MRGYLVHKAAIVLIGFASVPAHATDYSENFHGDLQNDRLAPTALMLSAGANRVLGTFGQPDVDYVTLTVPEGHALTAIRVGPGNSPGGVRSFIAVQSGAQMTVPANADDPSDLLGYAHVGFGSGDEILDQIAIGFGAIGFTPPLAAGDYTFWIQDTALAQPGMGFDFTFEVEALAQPQQVPAVPWLMLAVLFAGLAGVARRGNAVT